MKCSKCGANIEKSALYCPVCGEEIQWVPDYSTIETLMHQQQAGKDKKEVPPIEEEVEEQPQKQNHKTGFAISNSMKFMIGCILILVLVMFIINRVNYNSFDYQMAQAESAFSNKEYDKAMSSVDRALSLSPDSAGANVLLAQIFAKQGDTGTALPILLSVIKNNPDRIDAYGEVIRLYESMDRQDDIKTLLDECKSDKILEKYADYVCNPPKISVESGSYTKKQTITLTALSETDTIYYTLDGTNPTQNSKEYTESFTLGEGSTALNVIAVNDKGITSDSVAANYNITLKGPDTPQISPVSGEYSAGTKIEVKVPSGCTAYYEFDGTPTSGSTKYRNSVTMKEGEHIFSVILIDENGKASNVASATYVVYNS